MNTPKIQNNIDLQPHNTFKFPCIARYFVAINSIEQFQTLITNDIYKSSDHRLFLGGGSNILLTNETYDGIVIKNTIQGIDIIEQHQESVTIRVGGGVIRDELVHWSLSQGYHGLENLISIPGSVGAAPMQNIGAYGVEAGSFIKSVTYCDTTTGDTHTITATQCAFGYRDSIFKQTLKNKAFITHVTFTLGIYNYQTYQGNCSYGAITKQLASEDIDGTPTPTQIANAIATIRASKLPDRHRIGTAGSFFKNPILPTAQADIITKKHPELVTYPSDNGTTIKFSAGQLIDLAGCKGIQQGSVGTYKNHALVLIHTGGGTGQDLITLAKTIQSTVAEKFGILLEAEVNFV